MGAFLWDDLEKKNTYSAPKTFKIMFRINGRVKCFKDLAVDAFIVHRCSQRKKPLEVLREFLQNKEKRFYIIYHFFIAKNRRHQKA